MKDNSEGETLVPIFDDEMIFIHSSIGDKNEIYVVLVMFKCINPRHHHMNIEQIEEDFLCGVDLN